MRVDQVIGLVVGNQGHVFSCSDVVGGELADGSRFPAPKKQPIIKKRIGFMGVLGKDLV